MKILVKRLLAAAICLLLAPRLVAQDAGSSDGSETPAGLTVMTWNLEWLYDEHQGDNYSELAKEQSAPSRSDWDWKRDEIANSIAAVKPSIVGVQEAESRRVLWYLTRALDRNHQLEYQELAFQSRDFYTEQDVGILIRKPIEVISTSQRGYPQRMRQSRRYYDVTKHLIAEFELPAGPASERVIVINVHLRSRAKGEPFRLRQARLLHFWIADKIKAGENVIVLGDFNSEERGDTTRPESDIGIAAGLETETPDDDLVDLHLRLPPGDRQTHLLEGRQFDRILCSRSLMDDDPDRVDLVFQKIEVRRDLSIRGKPDTPEQHWDSYWQTPPEERDVSDHYPVIAAFELR